MKYYLSDSYYRGHNGTCMKCGWPAGIERIVVMEENDLIHYEVRYIRPCMPECSNDVRADDAEFFGARQEIEFPELGKALHRAAVMCPAKVGCYELKYNDRDMV